MESNAVMQLLAAGAPDDGADRDAEGAMPEVVRENTVLEVEEEDLVCNNVWNVYTHKKTGLAHGYRYDPSRKLGHISRTPMGLLECGGDIVAYQHPDTLTIHPAVATPQADGRERFIKALATSMQSLGMYVHQNTFKLHNGRELIPLSSASAFDSWLARSIIFWNIMPDKDGDPEVKLVTLQERVVKQVFNDPGLKSLLPRIDSVLQVQQPYFAGKRVVAWNPIGYNADTKTMTLGACTPRDKSSDVTDRWFKRLIKDYEFREPEVDIPALLCQMIGTYCSELFYDFDENGNRGERYITPISVIDSNATGSGKTMLMKLMSLPSLGVTSEVVAEKPEEVEKIITSKILAGDKYLYLDEAERILTKGLLTIVTGRHEGRILKSSETVSGDITLMVSGCNIEFSEMLARRAVVCKLWTTCDPDKKKFSRVIEKGDLTSLRRPMLTHVRNMVMSWVNMGCPMGKGNSNWDRFAKIVGGILKANGYSEPWEKRAGASIIPESSSDAQLPDFLRKLEDKSLDIGVAQWKNVAITMADLRGILQGAGYYEWIRDDVSGLRALSKRLKPWSDAPREVIAGVYLRTKHTKNGKVVWFAKTPVDEPEYTLHNGQLSKAATAGGNTEQQQP
jgi:hypothetical protein